MEAIYADPTGVAWDTLYTVVDAAYYPIDIVSRPLGFTTHAVDRTNARINDALGAAQELKVNTVANWQCRNWEGLGSNLAAIGMVVNPRSLVKGNVTPTYKNLEPVIKLAPGKKGGWNKTLNKDLQSNAIYKVGNYTYRTDDLGRVKSVSGELDLSKVDRNTYQQAKAGKSHGIKDGLIDDEGGHLIASIFKGPGEQINYAAMDGNLNKGAWKRMENKWAKALKGDPPKKVEVEINAIYDGDSKRPSTFDVFYEIDGVEKFVSFKNKPEGKLL
ncbi:DNA/RNA non-specific endonuclease [Photobacterium sanguinicancri]|nr:DNA/RNA non-specific endonuclease [Photobacterium sanguinicancri]